MKKEHIKYLIYAAGLGLIVFYLGNINRRKHAPCPSSLKIKCVSVAQILNNPEALTGRFKVKGIVGSVFPEKSIFFLIDPSSKKLPVQYKGELPKQGDQVKVFGRIVSARKGKLVVLADKTSKTCRSRCSPKKPIPEEVLSVNQIAVDPYSFVGKEIKVKGIVKGSFPDKSLFGLAECKKNPAAGCGGAVIPVRYNNQAPKENQCVIIKGTIRSDEEGKLFMEALKINLIKPPGCKPL